MIEPLLLMLVVALTIGAAAYDVTTLTIPNWMSLMLVALFPPLAFAAGLSLGEFGIHVAIGFSALIVGMLLFAGNVIGGGDAKLFAALALFMGTWAGFFAFAVAVAGGVLACAVLLLRWIARSGYVQSVSWLRHLTTTGAGIPYGVAIAAGALFVLPATHLYTQTIVAVAAR